MLENLKKSVCVANLELVERGIVLYTWGNASGISEDRQYMVIKPSGVPYSKMKPTDMVVVSLFDGKIAEGRYRPSSDTGTHLELYRRYPDVGGIAHTHSINAVAFAQAGCDIPAFGTTHADTFYGNIPCTRQLRSDEVEKEYEENTGRVLIEELDRRGTDPLNVPGALVRGHGPFTWGANVTDAVYNAVVMETVAEMALKTLLLNASAVLPAYVLDKHYKRKHGPGAYYGQGQPLSPK